MGHLQSLEELQKTPAASLKTTFNWIQSSESPATAVLGFFAAKEPVSWIRGHFCMPLVDTHAHLDQEEFDADRADMIARSRSPRAWKRSSPSASPPPPPRLR